MSPVFAIVWFAVAGFAAFQLFREWQRGGVKTSRGLQWALLSVGALAAAITLLVR